MSSSATPAFAWKYALAGVSVASYWLVVQLAAWLEGVPGTPEPGRWVHYAIGASFGVLVLGPYAPAPRRWLRIAALAVASVAIYYGAIRFVIDAPPGMTSRAAFVLSGCAAALLAGVAVALLAARRLNWPYAPLLLAAGVVGGAAFDLRITRDAVMLAGHAVWQLAVCAALHLAFADRGRRAASGGPS